MTGRIVLAQGPWVAAIGAVLALGFAVYEYQRISDFVAHGVEATGVVVRVDQRQEQYWDEAAERSRYRTVYAPVVRFADAAGVTRTERAGQFSTWRFHSVGDGVSVLYDPRDPAEVRINSVFELWSRTAVAAVCGVFAAVFALGAFSARSGSRRRLKGMRRRLEEEGFR